MIRNTRNYTSFTYFNIAQFLGALNDNIFKLLIIFLLIEVEGIERSNIVLSSAAAIFVIPFLLFSQASGVLADRKSKRNVIVAMKLMEVVVMFLGMISFWMESKYGSYFILFMMATQSAIFGPSKYGIVPEIVNRDRISKANGLLSMFTYLAIILGTFLASFLTDITGRNFVLSGFCCTLIALLGFWSSTKIEHTPPSGSKDKYTIFFLPEIYTTILRARKRSHLLTVMLGASFFWFLATFMQLNIIPFAMKSLSLSDVQGGYLFILIALGIGLGSVLAGKISGKSVELGLVPFGGLGLVIAALLMTIFAVHLKAVMVIVIIMGMAGGIFAIPQESFIQYASADKFRGQTIGAFNFLSFCGVLCAAIVLYLVGEVWKLSPRQAFFFMGCLTMIVTLLIMFAIFDRFLKFLSVIISRIFFNISTNKSEEYFKRPKIIVVNHASWTKTLLLMATRYRGMHLVMKCSEKHYRWKAPLYRLFKMIPIVDSEKPYYTAKLMKDVHNSIKHGMSIGVYINEARLGDDITRKKEVLYYKPTEKIFKETVCSIVPVRIYRKKHGRSMFSLIDLFTYGRTPVKIVFSEDISRENPLDDIEKNFIKSKK